LFSLSLRPEGRVLYRQPEEDDRLSLAHIPPETMPVILNLAVACPVFYLFFVCFFFRCSSLQVSFLHLLSWLLHEWSTKINLILYATNECVCW
jgi:hypothetical protein